jgi:hypothetical protein
MSGQWQQAQEMLNLPDDHAIDHITAYREGPIVGPVTVDDVRSALLADSITPDDAIYVLVSRRTVRPTSADGLGTWSGP